MSFTSPKVFLVWVGARTGTRRNSTLVPKRAILIPYTHSPRTGATGALLAYQQVLCQALQPTHEDLYTNHHYLIWTTGLSSFQTHVFIAGVLYLARLPGAEIELIIVCYQSVTAHDSHQTCVEPTPRTCASFLASLPCHQSSHIILVPSQHT